MEGMLKQLFIGGSRCSYRTRLATMPMFIRFQQIEFTAMAFNDRHRWWCTDQCSYENSCWGGKGGGGSSPNAAWYD